MPVREKTKKLMAHYMPWFEAHPNKKAWGWHWTMNHFKPEKEAKGQREAASKFYPLLGLYDGSDTDVLRCHALLMKMAGINGVIFDWYGPDDFLDYTGINRTTEKMIPILQEAGLQFALCYETQTVPKLLEAGKIPGGDTVKYGQAVMKIAQTRFFNSPAYLRLDNRPVFLVFGNPYYNSEQWNQILGVLPAPPAFFTESDKQDLTAPIGGFDWPQPGKGDFAGEQAAFYKKAAAWTDFVPAAYPRFADIYKEAGIGNSYGHIPDNNGRTYEETLRHALQSSARVVQIATWNDWGEGTQIEPSVEFGYRDLETTQKLRRADGKAAPVYTAQDLRLPVRWVLLRKKYADNPAACAKLAPFFTLVVLGRMKEARSLLARFDR